MTTGREAQQMFEAMFDHTPKTDTRTPEMVAAGLTAADALELR
jgi:hypothetical protein